MSPITKASMAPSRTPFALLVATAIFCACGGGTEQPPIDANGVDACVGPDYSQESLAPYYQSCTDTSCPSPYECVTVEALGGTHDWCLLPCCDSSACPGEQGCLGTPDFSPADVGPDGYCATGP